MYLRKEFFNYDANGRQNYSAQFNASGPVTVIFDGAGQRVATKAGDYLSVSVYDAGGKPAAEYAQTTAPTTANVDFITPNYQGSTAVVTDNGGLVKSRHDYLPFGEELSAWVGSRTTGKMFNGNDTVRQKYAGMETDDATGLNHTLWRKDDNWSGRWTSPDPYSGSMSTGDPQSFNRYTYCNNDPVNHLDPLGLSLADIGVYQTEDSGLAGQMESEMTRRFRLLTSPGGRQYVKQQEKERKDQAPTKSGSQAAHGRSPRSGQQTQTGGAELPADVKSSVVADTESFTIPGEEGFFLVEIDPKMLELLAKGGKEFYDRAVDESMMYAQAIREINYINSQMTPALPQVDTGKFRVGQNIKLPSSVSGSVGVSFVGTAGVTVTFEYTAVQKYNSFLDDTMVRYHALETAFVNQFDKTPSRVSMDDMKTHWTPVALKYLFSERMNIARQAAFR